MPAPLIEETVMVKWRLNEADYALLQMLYPGKVNTIGREIVKEFCDRLRARAGLSGRPPEA